MPWLGIPLTIILWWRHLRSSVSAGGDIAAAVGSTDLGALCSEYDSSHPPNTNSLIKWPNMSHKYVKICGPIP